MAVGGVVCGGRTAHWIAATAALLLAAANVCAQPYSPPPSDFTKFWEEPAFSRYKPRGPDKARGLILYSHGERGANIPSWDAVPEAYLQDFAEAGWDILKINRNHLHRIPHDTAADYVIERARQARADGYARVIAAGQSYGAGVSVLAGAKSDIIWGVLATAPGFGSSEGCGALAWSSGSRTGDNSLDRVLDELRRAKAQKLVVLRADGDECYPFIRPAWFDGVRSSLSSTKARWVFLDHAMPIRGHGVASTAQFRAWFGQCLIAFFNDVSEAAAGEVACEGPKPAPRYLLPAEFRARSLDGASVIPGKFIGAWSGDIRVDPDKVKATSFRGPRPSSRDVCVVVLEERSGELRAMVALGAGEERRLSMASYTLRLKHNAGAYEYIWPSKHMMAVQPREGALGFTYFDTTLTWEGELKPGCRVTG